MAVDRNLSVWLAGIQIALEDFRLVEVMPNNILLCGGGAGLIALQEKLATGDWYKELSFARRPVVHLVETEDIPGISNSTDTKLDHSYITALGLLRVAMDTTAEVPEEGGLRSKLAKITKI